MRKRLLSLFLCVCMVLTMLTLSAIPAAAAGAGPIIDYAFDAGGGRFGLAIKSTLPAAAKTYTITVTGGSLYLTSTSGFTNAVSNMTVSTTSPVAGVAYRSVQFNAGGMDASAIRKSLESVTFSMGSTVRIYGSLVNVQSGDVYWNGHIYRAVPTKTTWVNAMNAALQDTSYSSYGYSAYPITVTSEEENVILVNLYTRVGDIWLGAVPKGGLGPDMIQVSGRTVTVGNTSARSFQPNTPLASGTWGTYFQWIQGTPANEAGQALPSDQRAGVFWNNVSPNGGGPIYIGWQGPYWDDLDPDMNNAATVNVAYTSMTYAKGYAIEYSTSSGTASSANAISDSITVSSSAGLSKAPVDFTLTTGLFCSYVSGTGVTVESTSLGVTQLRAQSGTVTVKVKPAEGYFIDTEKTIPGVIVMQKSSDGTYTLMLNPSITSNINISSAVLQAGARVTDDKGKVTNNPNVGEALLMAKAGYTVEIVGKPSAPASDIPILAADVTVKDLSGHVFRTADASVKVDVDAQGNVTVKSGAVRVDEGKKMKAGYAEYTGKAGGTELTVDGTAATLDSGAVGVSTAGIVKVCNTTVVNTSAKEITVTKDHPDTDQATVYVPQGGTVTIGGETYNGLAYIVIGADGAVVGEPKEVPDLYVSDEGSDETGDGSRAHPYKTITKAAAMSGEKGADIHVMGDLTVTAGATINAPGKTITVDGEGALKYGEGLTGPMLTVSGGTVELQGVDFSGGDTAAAPGLQVAGGDVTLTGVSVTGFESATGAVNLAGGSLTIGKDTQISENGTNVYLARGQYVTLGDDLGAGKVGVTLQETVTGLNSRKIAENAQAADIDTETAGGPDGKLTLDHDTVHKLSVDEAGDVSIVPPVTEETRYYISEDGAEYTAGDSDHGTREDPYAPDALDKLSGDFVEFVLLSDITLPKSAYTTPAGTEGSTPVSDDGNYGMRVISSHFTITSEGDEVYTISRDTDIVDGAPMFWVVGGGAMELKNVNISDGAAATHGPVIRAGADENSGTDRFTHNGSVVLENVTFQGVNAEGGTTSYGQTGAVIDFESDGGTLTLMDVTFADCTAPKGAVYVGEGANVVVGGATDTGELAIRLGGEDPDGPFVTVADGFAGAIAISAEHAAEGKVVAYKASGFTKEELDKIALSDAGGLGLLLSEGKTKLVLGNAVYALDGGNYANWADVARDLPTAADQTVTLVGAPQEDETIDLTGVTLVDGEAGDRYTGGKVQVAADTGEITVLGDGTTTYAPGGEAGAGAKVNTGVEGANPHTVNVAAGESVDIAVTNPADGEGAITATAAVADGETAVDIDGVRYTGATQYDLDAPMKNGVTATVPAGKSVSVPTDQEDGGFTVTDPAESEGAIQVTMSDQGDVKGFVELDPGESATVKVGAEDTDGTTYTADAEGAVLELVSKAAEDGSVQEYVELAQGSVRVSDGGEVTVNGHEIAVSGGDVTVTKDAPEAGKTRVRVPASRAFQLGGGETRYEGPGAYAIDADGTVTSIPADYYVDANAEAGGDGSYGKPFKTLEEAVAAANASKTGANLHVLSDLELTAGVTITGQTGEKAAPITITSEGGPWTIQRAGTFAAPMVSVTAGAVEFTNITLDGNGGTYPASVEARAAGLDITGGTVTLGNGAVVENSRNTNSASWSAGGVRVLGDGAVLNIQEGAEIRNNSANIDGGGVLVRNGTVNMTGGRITGNQSASYGAGLYATTSNDGGSVHQSGYASVVNISGGEISNNFCSSAASGGGPGIFVTTQAQVNMTGGMVRNNGIAASAAGVSAGVTLWSTVSGEGGLTVGGTAVIQDNYIGAGFDPETHTVTTDGASAEECNIYLAKSGSSIPRPIRISTEEPLASGAYIGVSVAGPVGDGTETIARSAGEEEVLKYARYFHSDDSDYVVKPSGDNKSLVLGKAVYRVDDAEGNPYYYDAWADVQAALGGDLSGVTTVYLVGKPAEEKGADRADLTGVTLMDERTDESYAGGKVSVGTDGSVTVLGDADGSTTTYTPGVEGTGVQVNTKPDGASDKAHTVTGAAGKSMDVTVTAGADGVTTATVTPKAATDGVTIDGVTFQAPEGTTPAPAYDVDDPWSALPQGGTATLPEGADSPFTVPSGAEDGEGFAVQPSEDGPVAITKDGATESKTGGVVQATVDVPAEGGAITVGDVTYTAPAEAEDGAVLGLVTIPGEGDSPAQDVVELRSGAVELPGKAETGNSLYVNGTPVTNSDPAHSVTATMDEPSEGKATVDVPEGGKATVGGAEFQGPAQVVVDENGRVSMQEGTVTLPPKAEDGDAAAVDVIFPGGEGAADRNITVTNPDPDKAVEVTVPISEEDGRGQAKVPAGGQVTFDYNTQPASGDTYAVPEGEEETVFAFDGKGNVTITGGAVTLADEQDVGFGNVTLGNGGKEAEAVEGIQVAVQPGGETAQVTVPAGETFTVTDPETGETHSYHNNGEGPVTLTVDQDGNVTAGTLPSKGLELSGGATVTVGEGEEANTYTAGEKGATLAPDGETSNPALLTDGSVILPDSEDGSTTKVKVKSGETTREIEGRNVEVYADAADAGAAESAGKPAVRGRIPHGGNAAVLTSEYYVPADGVAVLDEDGHLGAPAVGKLTGNLGHEDKGYVVVPDTENNDENRAYLYNAGQTEEGKNALIMDDKAAFDVREKGTAAAPDYSDGLGKSTGHYQAEESGTQAQVDLTTGAVTLTDGTAHVTKGETDPAEEAPALTVGGVVDGKGVVSGEDFTVAITRDEDGAATGGDITVPGGKRVDIDGQTYQSADPEKELKLHIDPDGTVRIVDGTVKLGEGDGVGFGETAIEGSDKADGEPAVTVTVPAAEDSENAKVEVAPSADGAKNTVTVGDDVYTNGSADSDLTLEVTPEGGVVLDSGSVTLPDNGEAADTAAVTVPVGEGENSQDYTVSGDDVTVTKDETTGGNATVTVPGNSGVTVTDGDGGKSAFQNAEEAADLVVELTPDGPVLKEGSAQMAPGGSVTVNSAEVENTGSEDITVTKDPETGKAAVDIPAGGRAVVNGVEIQGPARVEIDEEGNASITPEPGQSVTVDGRTYTRKEGTESGEVRIGKPAEGETKGTVTAQPKESFIVKIQAPTQGVVHLDPGETLTFTVEGRTATLTGGDAGADITVDENGVVTLTDPTGAEDYGRFSAVDGAAGPELTLDGQNAALTGGTVHIGPETQLAMDEVVYTGGSPDGATLTYGTQAGDGPILEDGSVVLPETGAKVQVKTGGSRAALEGKNVEVFANDGGAPAVVGQGETGGEATLNGVVYTVPSGAEKSPVKGQGAAAKLGAPAQGRVVGNQGTDTDPYVIVPSPDSAGGDKPIYGGDRTGDETHMDLSQGASFDVRARGDGTAAEPAGPSKGVYTAQADHTDATVNHATGEVTITDGTLHVAPGEAPDSDSAPALTVGGVAEGKGTVSGEDFTVSVTKDAQGRPNGGDITVPGGKSVTANGGDYPNADPEKDLKLHIGPDGSVSILEGSVDLGAGDRLTFGETTLQGSDQTGGEPAVNVTVPAAPGSENARVVVDPSAGGRKNAVTVGGETYTNDSADQPLDLEVTPAGGVTLNSGSVTLPDNGQAADAAAVTVPVGEGENSRDYTVSGDGVTVTRDETTGGNAVARTKPGGDVTVRDGEGEITYIAPAGQSAAVELTPDGPQLAGGAVELDPDEAIAVNGVDVENTGAGKVTVTKDDETGKAVVDIPAGGRAVVNGVEVEGPARVEIDSEGNATITPAPAGKGSTVAVGGVTYTDISDSGTGSVNLDKDGKLTVTDMAGALPALPARNVRLPEGGSVTYDTPEGAHVTLTGGMGGATVDVDEKGDVTVQEGEALVKGEVAADVAETAPEDARATYVGDVTIYVTTESGDPVQGAEVTIHADVTYPDGTPRELVGVTDENGRVVFPDVPYGIYDVDVTMTRNGKTYAAKGSVKVDAPEVSGNTGVFILSGLSMETEVKSDLPQAAAPSLTVDDVGKFATSADKDTAKDSTAVVTVTLNANTLKAGSSADMTQEDVAAITESLNKLAQTVPGVSGEDALTDLIDVTVTKTVTVDGQEGEPTSLTSTPTLMTLSFPLSEAMKARLVDGVTADHIFVLRQHGSNTSVRQLPKVTESYGRTSSRECYFIQRLNDVTYIVIRANQFSVYAFGVSATAIEPQELSSGGYSGGGRGGRGEESTITIPETRHGSVSVSSKRPSAGQTVTVTATPEAGYQLNDLTVTDASGRAVTLTANGDGTYTFVMPDGSVTVLASFGIACDREENCPMYPFQDADRQAWYHDGVHYVVDKGLMIGTGPATFAPGLDTSRAMVVTILYRLAGEPGAPRNIAFADVAPGLWYTDAVSWAAANGIVEGYSQDAFGPEDAITREQMVTILRRYAAYKGVDVSGQADLTGYTDASAVSDWAREGVTWAVQAGLIQGRSATTLVPGGTSTRAETATILMRYCEDVTK